ncbi:superinfection immunity protein [Microbulbifer salipaludis]|uniref:Superinfection immunity protein n=1 Tax=Microbulbifer salipaludis TaxID=187980 RepID=A0ABS3E3X2_9GAMM|nr:superinfection immunity protein [Microbulbifer salipaludis]MBN8429986.1 superinfection immunity protein [Microbulbifer salipaludis]
MLSNLEQKLSGFLDLFAQMDLLQTVGFVIFFFAIWFLPSLLAIFFNRNHLGKIFLANVPAGLSWIAWVALLVWAATGKMSGKLTAKYGSNDSRANLNAEGKA